MVNFRKWFGGGEREGDRDLLDLTLDHLQMGWLVDYDLETWEVIGYNTYDYDGFVTREWELRSGREVRFLELAEEDGQRQWTLTRSLPLADINEDVPAAIAEEDEPPEVLHCRGGTYEGVASEAGVYTRVSGGGSDTADTREFVAWTYEDGHGGLLFLSRYGERDLSAYEGHRVEEYQFTDILPGGGA